MGLLAKLLTTAMIKQVVKLVLTLAYENVDKINFPNLSPSVNAQIKVALKLLLDNLETLLSAITPAIKEEMKVAFTPVVAAYESELGVSNQADDVPDKE